MPTTTDQPALRFATVGLGQQGAGAAVLAIAEGYTMIGAVDVGDKVGRPISEFVDHADAPGVPVAGSVEELIAAAGKPDVAMLSISASGEVVTDIAKRLLASGVNVVTIAEVLFEGQGPLAESLDAVARENGVSIIAGGLQDTLWVHLPAAAAAAVTGLQRVRLDDFADCSYFSHDVAVFEAGVGLDDAAFAEWRKERLAEPPIQGAPLRELARLLGFEPDRTTYEIQSCKSDKTMGWSGADTTVAPGLVTGAKLLVSITTKEGPTFEGSLVFKLAEEGENDGNSIIIEGDRQTLTLKLPSPDYGQCVTASAMRRFQDAVTAPPGFVRVAELAPSRYRHTVR